MCMCVYVCVCLCVCVCVCVKEVHGKDNAVVLNPTRANFLDGIEKP